MSRLTLRRLCVLAPRIRIVSMGQSANIHEPSCPAPTPIPVNSQALMIAGRILQGAGAISDVAIAMAADLTRESQRSKSMAIIGSTIGVVFALSFIVAPFLKRLVDVPGIFAVTGVLALCALAVVRYAV